MPTIKAVILKFMLNRRLVVLCFWWCQIILLLWVLAAIQFPIFKNHWSQFGRWFADGAILLYVFTLLPGILKRLQVTGLLAQFQLFGMMFRRQAGISMFLFVFYHYLFSRLLILITYKATLLPSDWHEMSGILGFLLVTPLFLTSNDFSVKWLGSRWKLLHKLTYVIMWVIMIHLLLLARPDWTTALIISTCLLEVLSHIISMINHKKNNQI